MSEEYWTIDRPEYDDEDQDAFVNGTAVAPHETPRIECRTCGQTWIGGRVHPFFCPVQFAGIEIAWNEMMIEEAEFKKLRRRVNRVLRAQGHPDFDLRPGDDFQPFMLDLPSRPRYDFLWSGFASVFVTKKVRDLFIEAEVSGIVFCDARVRKVGRSEPFDEPPVSGIGDDDFFIDDIPLEEYPEKFGPRYQMVVVSRIDFPPETENLRLCPKCDNIDREDEERGIVIDEQFLPDTDVFTVGLPFEIHVRRKVHDLILQHNLSNVALAPF